MQDERNNTTKTTNAQEEKDITQPNIKSSPLPTHEIPGANARKTCYPSPDDDDYCSPEFLKQVE